MSLVTRAKNKINSWHLSEYVPKMVRGPVFGNIITIGVAEGSAYRLMTRDMEVGSLPPYMPFLVIPLISILQALLGPLISWLGLRTPRRVLLTYSVALLFIPMLWFLVPPPDNIPETELCNSTIINTPIVFESFTTEAALRLAVVLFTGISMCLLRVAYWSHFVAYSDELAPERTCVHMGILTIAWILPLVFYNFLTLSIGILNNFVSVLILTIVTIMSTTRLYFNIPRTQSIDTKESSMGDRGFFQSLKRVLFNHKAMTQMISMGLVAGALWSFAYNDKEIIKTNYNIFRDMESIVDNYTLFFKLFLAIISILYMGVKQSAPIRDKYDVPKGLRVAYISSMIAAVLYLVVVIVPPCKKGAMAGLETELYSNPQCSLSCGCIPRWMNFDPVCVVDSMTTYLSPCEAGCTSSRTIDNLRVYTNCSCAASGHAIPGACSDSNCQLGYEFHISAFCIILTVSAVALQAQSMVVLRSVDPRDKAVAIGVMWSVVSVIAFVICNNFIFYMGLISCRWMTGDRCQLHSDWYPYVVGIVCAALMFTAFIINRITRRSILKKLKVESEPGPSGA